MNNKQKKTLRFLASQSHEAQIALAALTERYAQTPRDKADVIIALGGDGFLLKTIHETMSSPTPIYGMNRGGVGFLMNEFHEENLYSRINQAIPSSINPLEMTAIDINGQETQALAINEAALWRQSCQSARIQISIDERIMMEEMSGDGILVATPAGSTAYNLSAQGPILPLEAPLLALTPINPFRPRRWSGALVSNKARILFEVLEDKKRPVNASADHKEIRSVKTVSVRMLKDLSCTLLFDPDHSWNERILREQFKY